MRHVQQFLALKLPRYEWQRFQISVKVENGGSAPLSSEMSFTEALSRYALNVTARAASPAPTPLEQRTHDHAAHRPRRET